MKNPLAPIGQAQGRSGGSLSSTLALAGALTCWVHCHPIPPGWDECPCSVCPQTASHHSSYPDWDCPSSGGVGAGKQAETMRSPGGVVHSRLSAGLWGQPL